MWQHFGLFAATLLLERVAGQDQAEEHRLRILYHCTMHYSTKHTCIMLSLHFGDYIYYPKIPFLRCLGGGGGVNDSDYESTAIRVGGVVLSEALEVDVVVKVSVEVVAAVGGPVVLLLISIFGAVSFTDTHD